MTDHFQVFARATKDLARNPLGIIALFILLVYGFACLVLGFGGKNLESAERFPLVWFLVVFPVVVLCVFYLLVTKHHRKLYAPSDFRDESHFFNQQDEALVARQPSSGANPQDVDELMKAGEGSVVVENNEEAIKRDLEMRSLHSDSEAERVLIRHLAVAQAGLWFERTYNLIFGTQIRLLKHLNEIKKPVNSDFMDQYFALQQQRFPQEFTSWTTTQYLEFMLSSQLIEIVDQQYQITPEGAEFLIEITRRGLSEGKAL